MSYCGFLVSESETCPQIWIILPALVSESFTSIQSQLHLWLYSKANFQSPNLLLRWIVHFKPSFFALFIALSVRNIKVFPILLDNLDSHVCSHGVHTNWNLSYSPVNNYAYVLMRGKTIQCER